MPSPETSVRSPARLRTPVWLWVVSSLVFIGVMVAWPPFRIVSRSKPREGKALSSAEAFEPTRFAEKFWSEKLQPAGARATDLDILIPSLRQDYAAALKSNAHQAGVGGAAYFFVRGSGKVVAVERSRLILEIANQTIALRTGPVFGNTVRDGCGLIELNEAPGLAEFNALSAELNRLVETRVQPQLKDVAVGATVRFVGCAEAPESLPTQGPWLTVIPTQAETRP